ncbi:hypothetical protein TNCV_4923351 [Trichonephila clavipes]|nr:hypothetical protein TNCV_4923351 [Trichonephila clavipes]
MYNRRRNKASLYKEDDLVAFQRTQSGAGLKRTINVNFVYYRILKQHRLVNFRSAGLNNFSAEAYYPLPVQHVTFFAHVAPSATSIQASKHEKAGHLLLHLSIILSIDIIAELSTFRALHADDLRALLALADRN